MLKPDRLETEQTQSPGTVSYLKSTKLKEERRSLQGEFIGNMAGGFGAAVGGKTMRLVVMLIQFSFALAAVLIAINALSTVLYR